MKFQFLTCIVPIIKWRPPSTDFLTMFDVPINYKPERQNYPTFTKVV